MTLARSSLLTFAAPLLIAACCVGPALAEPGAMGEPKMLIHGNYCGPGNNAPLPPIDALDAACARHDACTPYGGLPSQACNRALQRDAASVSRDLRQPDDLRALAGIVAATATLIPSGSNLRHVPAAVSVGPEPEAYDPIPRFSAPPADMMDDEDSDGAD